MRIANSGKYLYVFAFFVLLSLQANAQNLSLLNSSSVAKHPKVSYDGTQMVFMANYDGRAKLYISKIDTGTWQAPQAIFDQEISGRFQFQYPQLSFDNTTLYYSAKAQGKTDYDIYYSKLKNGKWSSPEPLDIGINTNLNELSPSVSANGKKVLFARPVPDKDEFCHHIYLTKIDEYNNWSKPKMLPSIYNTGCVTAPYYTNDNMTFFYSSYEEINDAEGKRLSKKQFNVYWAKIDGSTQYNPKPLLSLIGEENTTSFSMDTDKTFYYGYGDVLNSSIKKRYSSIQANVLNNSFKPEPVTLLTGKTLDENNNPIQAVIKIVDPYTSLIYQQVNCDKNGNYQVFLPTNKQYSILASKQSYSIKSTLITTKGKTEVINFELFQEVEITFNIYDEEFFFPLNTKLTLYDSVFNEISTVNLISGRSTTVNIGKELNVIFNTEDYFVDTLNLPFHDEVIFNKFDFDIELVRKLKQVGFSFSDEKTGNNLGLEITVYNVTRNEKTKRRVKDGKIILDLRDGEVYEISTSAQGYSYFTTELDLSKEAELTAIGINEEGVLELKAALKSVKDQAIVLSNIIFGANSYDLNALSYIELNKLATYLSENEDYHVEITAHTDAAGPAEYNLKLSNRRANTVVEYLQDHAIKRNRLISIGHGEEFPISPNDTPDNMAKNRRVEFKIINTSE